MYLYQICIYYKCSVFFLNLRKPFTQSDLILVLFFKAIVLLYRNPLDLSSFACSCTIRIYAIMNVKYFFMCIYTNVHVWTNFICEKIILNGSGSAYMKYLYCALYIVFGDLVLYHLSTNYNPDPFSYTCTVVRIYNCFCINFSYLC